MKNFPLFTDHYEIKSLFYPVKKSEYLPNGGVSWSFKENHPGFGNLSINEANEKSLKLMEKLYFYLNSKNISLSVAVYPWPHHIYFDKENSKFVENWKRFCEKRCFQFFNLFQRIR